MAEKHPSKGAVEKLLNGRLDPRSQTAREISDAVAERVLRDANKASKESNHYSA